MMTNLCKQLLLRSRKKMSKRVTNKPLMEKVPEAIPVRKVLDTQGEYRLVKAKRCSKCCQPVPRYASHKTNSDIFHEQQEQQTRMLELLSDIPERQSRTMMRKIKEGKM